MKDGRNEGRAKKPKFPNSRKEGRNEHVISIYKIESPI